MAILITVVLIAVVMLLAFFRATITGWLLAAMVFVPLIAIESRISDTALQVVTLRSFYLF